MSNQTKFTLTDDDLKSLASTISSGTYSGDYIYSVPTVTDYDYTIADPNFGTVTSTFPSYHYDTSVQTEVDSKGKKTKLYKSKDVGGPLAEMINGV